MAWSYGALAHCLALPYPPAVDGAEANTQGN